jgi:gliding motility-associated-like protein
MGIRMKYKLYVIVLLWSSVLAYSQTVNNGLLAVAPSTIMSTVDDFNNTETGDFLNDGEVYFYANFNNDGLVDFDPQFDGYSRFNGSNPQKITGTMPSSFKNILFYNPNIQPAFQLYGDIVIYGDSEFNQGIVNNDDFGGSITFESEATHTNTWNGSHVDGKVTRKGNAEFDYPVGDKNLYRYAKIATTSEQISNFTVQYFFENSDPTYTHSNRQEQIELMDDREYWTIENTGNATDILLTLSWDEVNTTPRAIITLPATDIHIVRWDKTRNIWVDEGGVADLATKTITTAITASEDGIYTLARVKTKIQPCVKIYNAVTPNGDGKNDYFLIDCIEKYPNNTLQIFNRWGVMVFNTKNYDTYGNVFRGTSEGRSTVDGSKTLPTGTYFYVLTFEGSENGKTETYKQTGYLYLNTP